MISILMLMFYIISCRRVTFNITLNNENVLHSEMFLSNIHTTMLLVIFFKLTLCVQVLSNLHALLNL